MRKIKVVKKNHKYTGEIKHEGTILEYDESGFILKIFLPNISIDEIKDFQNNSYRFVLSKIENHYFFLSEFEGFISLSDSPFEFALYQDKFERIKFLPFTF